MTPDQLLAFLLFALVAAVTPGPSNIILTSTGATVGVIRGLPCLFGASLGMGSIVFAVGVGVGSIVLGNALLLTAVKWGGIAFLLWLSWQIATSRHENAAQGAPVVGFWRGAALQWANPKAWVVSVSAAGTFLQAGAASALAQSAAFGFLFILAALPSGLLWLALGSSVQRWLRTDRSWTTFNRAMAALLAASIVLFIW
jgi:threonine/homoserine/homoserine lactone efflux protein